jgi:hypothetical protein
MSLQLKIHRYDLCVLEVKLKCIAVSYNDVSSSADSAVAPATTTSGFFARYLIVNYNVDHTALLFHVLCLHSRSTRGRNIDCLPQHKL